MIRMRKRGKLKYLLNTVLFTLLVTYQICASEIQKVSEIPSINFQVSNKIIKIDKLDSFNATDLAVNKSAVLFTNRRNIYLLKKGQNKLKKYDMGTELPISAWFSPICASAKNFFIHVADYPSVQQEDDALKYRGDFIAAPSSVGFVIIENNLHKQRQIKSLKIVSRSFVQNGKENSKVDFSDLVQSCAYYGGQVFLGSYGSIGKADLNKETIALIDQDEEMTFNRNKIFIENKFIWINKDEGGLDGASIEKWSHKNIKINDYSINNGYDMISYTAFARHKGKMIIGTTHGLFSLDEQTGRFAHFDLGKEVTSMPIDNLVQWDGYLWSFTGGQWFQIDIEKHTAIRLIDEDKNKFTNGVFFDGTWILIGPSGIWKKEK